MHSYSLLFFSPFIKLAIVKVTVKVSCVFPEDVSYLNPLAY